MKRMLRLPISSFQPFLERAICSMFSFCSAFIRESSLRISNACRLAAFFLLLLLAAFNVNGQTTYDFSSGSTLSYGDAGFNIWYTQSNITVDGVSYKLTSGGNGSLSNAATGGNGNSKCLMKSGSGDETFTLARADGQAFQFYGIWVKHKSMNNYAEFYSLPPFYTVTYNKKTGAPETYNDNTPMQGSTQPGVYTTSSNSFSKDLTVTSVTVRIYAADTYWIDDINVGPASAGAAPAITAQPPNRTICASGNTTFTVTASNATGYQWQVNNGSGYTNISNGAPYSGATTATLSITSATAGMSGYAYRCVATGATTPNATSNGGTLTVSSVSTTGSQMNIACNGGSNGSATVVASGGIAPYSYSWSPSGGTGATATGLAQGSYTVTVTDNLTCQATRNYTLTQPTAITANITSQTNVACNGASTGSATIAATGGTGAYTYSWSPSGGTAATATGLSAGTYTVTITDANACSITKNVIINQPTAITASITSQTNVACNGASTGSATIAATGGAGAYTYSWAPSGGTAATATGLLVGTYTVTITDANTCSITKNVTINQPTAIAVSVTSQTNVACNGGSTGSATVAVTGGAGAYTYSWSPSGGTAATATGLSAGMYTVTVTDANNCQKTRNVSITQPTAMSITPSQNNVTCGGSNGSATVSVTGGAGAYSYSWSPSGGTAATATGLTMGTYTCTITDANNCTATRNFTITSTAAIATTGSQTNVSCNNGSNGTATVTASGGASPYTYSWSPSGGTAASASGLVAGTYTVTVTDANLCQATRNFTITQPLALTATTSQTNVSCNSGSNGTATVSVSGGSAPYTYSWSPSGGVGATASGLMAGTYTCTITDANMCSITKNVTVTQPPVFTANITSQTNIACNGGSNGSATIAATGGTGSYTYSWSPSGGTAATATGLVAGTYTCTITDANTCTATKNVTITQPTAFAVTTSQNNITCNGGSNGSASVSVTGGTGTFFYSWAPNGGTGATASGLAAGTYTVTITDANECSTTRTFTITQPAMLTATATPASQTICSGQSTDIALTSSTMGASFNWTVSAVSGNVSGANAGSGSSIGQSLSGNGVVKYTVTPVMGSCSGSSVNVSVTVNALASIAMHPSNRSIDEEENTSFSIEADHTTGYQWQVNTGSGFTNITNSGVYSGATTVTLHITDPLGSMDGYSYRCVASGNCSPVTSNPATLAVRVRTVQHLTFAATKEAIYGDEDVAPGATSDAGLEITYTSSNENVATIVNGKIHILKAGETTITANQEGNNDYKPASAATQVVTIAKKDITATLNAAPIISKTYDGTLAATLDFANYTLNGVVNNDDVMVKGTAMYADKNTGTDKQVTVTELALNGEQKDNYRLTTASASVKGVIIKKDMTVALRSEPLVSKTYDATAAATLTADNYMLDGVIDEDQVSITGSAVYDNKNAGWDKTVTASDFVIAGTDKDNYNLVTLSATTSGDIKTKEITLSLVATPQITRAYNGKTKVNVSGDNYLLAGGHEGDNVLVSGQASYNNKNAGQDKTITITDFVLDGIDANNYHLTTVSATTTGSVTPAKIKALLQRSPAVSKVYDGTTNATLVPANYGVDGIIGEDEVKLNNPSVGAYDTKHGGENKVVTVTGLELSGEDAGNYMLMKTTISSAIGTISAKEITATAGMQSKVYGTPDPQLSYTTEGMLEGDTLPGMLERAAGKHVGEYAITVGSLSGGTDYMITTFTPAILNITPASLVIVAEDKTKKQGSTNPGFTFKYAGLAEGDKATDLETAPVATTNAASGSPIGYYDITVSGASDDNYTITYTTGKLTVTPASDATYNVKVWSSSPDVLQIKIYTEKAQKAAIILYTEGGQQVILQQQKLAVGINSFTMPVGHLASSHYILGVKAEQFKDAQKVRVK